MIALQRPNHPNECEALSPDLLGGLSASKSRSNASAERKDELESKKESPEWKLGHVL